jgi:hypothetical protein
MAELLAFLDIANKKDYHRWCLGNHPDRSDDPEAKRRFQIVSGAWSQETRAKTPEPELTEEEQIDLLSRGRCRAPVKDTVGNVCWRRPVNGSNRCFYHQPGTAHMHYVDDTPMFFFAASHNIYRERDESTCVARLSNGRFCTLWRAKNSLYCSKCGGPRRPRSRSF